MTKPSLSLKEKISASFLQGSRAFLNILLGLADITSQRPGQTPNSESTIFIYLRIGLLILLGFASLSLLEPALIHRFDKSDSPQFTIPFDSHRWKLIYSDSIQIGTQESCEGGLVNKNCPAHPDYLFSRPRATSARAANSLWMVYDLTADEAKLALKDGANILFSGRSLGKQKVYVNGSLMNLKLSSTGHEILSATLPLPWLQHKLRIAIWTEITIQLDANSAKRTPGTNYGLATLEQVQKHIGLKNFAEENLVYILAAIYFMFTGFFILLWSVMPHQKDPFVFAVFCFILGLLEISKSESTFQSLPAYQWHHLKFFLTTALALTIVWTGFAIARIRRELSVVIGTAFVCAYLYEAAISSTASEFYKVSKLFNLYLIPFAYITSVLMCLLQAFWVSHLVNSRNAYWLSGRKRILRLYTGIFILFAAIQITETQTPDRFLHLINYLRYIPILIFFLVAHRMFLDLYTKTVENNFAPLSRFHRMNPMASRVQGIFLDIDLKRSEALYRAASYSSDQNMFVNPFVENWMTMIRTLGGDLIQFQGDMILVLFEVPHLSPQKISELLTEITKSLLILDQQMPQIAVDLKEKTSISVTELIGRPVFRACISFGGIRPTLIGQGGFRIAGWMNTDENQVLLRLSRLGEAERLIISNQSFSEQFAISTIILDEETLPTTAVDSTLYQVQSLNHQYQTGIRTFLKTKGSIPPKLTIIYLNNETSSEFKLPHTGSD